MAAHDLRAPLTALRLQHYMLQKQTDLLTELQCETLHNAEASVTDMQNLIESLLNLEHIERQAQGSREVVALRSLLLSAISLVSTQVKLKNLRLDLDIVEFVPGICGDPVRLFEAIRNYLTNAVKYTPDNGQITVCVYADAQYVHLEVRDTGIGIDPNDLEHVFEPRFRAQTALAAEVEGQGIGLSLVKEIVEEHGGWVTAISQPRSGSTFSLSIPIQTAC